MLRVQGSGLRAQAQGSGIRAQGSGLRITGSREHRATLNKPETQTN